MYGNGEKLNKLKNKKNHGVSRRKEDFRIKNSVFLCVLRG